MTTKIPANHIRLKRAYVPPSAEDGTRILIDRLWPRGVKKETLALHEWMKDIAPSTELRQWFGHDPALWPEFRKRYTAELHTHTELVQTLRKIAQTGVLTLVYSAHDETHNDALVLQDFLLAN